MNSHNLFRATVLKPARGWKIKIADALENKILKLKLKYVSSN